jgi:hypothetical protein
LQPILEDQRQSEQELWAAFNKEHPRILGALLDAMVVGLKMLPRTKLDRLPRMADFAMWATACETAIWPNRTFMNAYDINRDEAIEDVIDADTVAAAIRAFMAKQTVWTGTATKLLEALGREVGDGQSKSKSWPNSPRALSGRLRRAATALRAIGIDIEFWKEGKGRTRMIHISAASESVGASPSAPSAASSPAPKSNPANGLAVPRLRLVDNDADGGTDDRGPGGPATVRAKPLKTNAGHAADGADADISSLSAPGKVNGWSGRL